MSIAGDVYLWIKGIVCQLLEMCTCGLKALCTKFWRVYLSVPLACYDAMAQQVIYIAILQGTGTVY